MTPNEQFVTWLNSAYAMEQSLAHVLENHAKDAKDIPEVQSRIQQHFDETNRHAERVKDALKLLDATPSTVKSVVGNVTGLVQSVSTGMYRDEIVKNFLADYASENFEIACYTSLIAAADELGHTELTSIFREILSEEESMASWIEEQIPMATRLQLQHESVST